MTADTYLPFALFLQVVSHWPQVSSDRSVYAMYFGLRHTTCL
jgi:hypothetical protein